MQEKPIIDVREGIAQDIKAIVPYDEQEKVHISHALNWIRSGAPLFRIAAPDQPPQHLVAYFVFIDLNQRSLLLVDHIKAQLWLPTGGHVAVDENPADTVRREAVEEVGKRAVFLRGNERPFFLTEGETVGLTPGHVDVSLWYLLRGSRYDFIAFNKREFNDIEWFSFEEVLQSDPAIFDLHMHRFTKKLVAALDGM